MASSSKKGQTPMDVESPAPSETDDDTLESEDEETSRYKKYVENRNKLNWLSMREKQIKIAIHYEKYKTSIPFIEDPDDLCEKISELKIKLEEVKNNKRCEDLLRTKQQIAGVLQNIGGPKRSNAKQSIFSEDQRKCIKDLLQKKKALTKVKNLKQKDIVSLEEKMEKMQSRNADAKGKKKQKSDLPHTNGGQSEKREEINILAARTHLLAKAMHSLSKHHMSLEPTSKDLKPVVFASSKIMENQLDDIDEIHSLLLMVHNLKV